MSDKRKEALLGLEEYLESLVPVDPSSPAHMQLPVTISGVDVTGSGANGTSPPILEAHVKPLLEAKSLKEIIKAADLTQAALNRLDVYSDVAVQILPTKTPSTLFAKVSIPAAKRFNIRTGTSVGNGEGSGYLKGTVKNLLKQGETFTLDTSVGTRTKTSSLIGLSLPLCRVLPLDWKLEMLGYTSEKIVEWASQRHQIRGVTFRVENPYVTFGFDAVLRTLFSTSLRPTATSIAQAGDSLKFALVSSYTRDTRDNRFLPGLGSLFSLNQELIFGDNPGYKCLVETQRGAALGTRGLHCTLSSKCGVLVPLGEAGSHVMDRFYLGGPLDVRSFRLNKIGPVDFTEALGGELMTAVGLSLYSPVPKVNNDNLKLHAYLNCGSLVSLNPRDPGSSVAELLSYPSVSSGIGLLYTHQIARFELNLGMPLCSRGGIALHKGLQFGVGLSFL